MKFIEPSFRIQSNESLLPAEKIETIGRICYRSEDKISDGSYGKFVENLIKRGHYSILEHINFNFKINGTLNDKFLITLSSYPGIFLNKTSRCLNVTMNLRNAIELQIFDKIPEFLSLIVANDDSFAACFSNLHSPDFPVFTVYRKQKSISTGKIKITFIPEAKVKKTDINTFYTVFFQIPRGIWDELARHRQNSCACESSRYCLYSKDKFDGQITFNKPVWWNEKGKMIHFLWKSIFWSLEKCYLLLSKYLPAQYVRGILPLDYSVKCCITANRRQWKHILKLRTSEGAHPEMKKLMTLLQKELNITNEELKSANLK